MEGVDIRNHPVTSCFSRYNPQILTRPIQNRCLPAHCIGVRCRVLWVEIFIRRHVADYVNVNPLWADAVLKKQAIVLQEVTELKVRIQIGLLASIPMAHERNPAFLRVAEARAGKLVGW